MLHDQGINVEAGLMFGFDQDDSSVFECTLDFAERIGIDAIQVSIVTPLPGTQLYDRMKREGRIIDQNWRNYDYRHVVFEPSKMSPAELQNGADWLIGEFYAKRRIVRRTLQSLVRGNISGTLMLSLPVNIGYHIDAARWNIKGVAPSEFIEESSAAGEQVKHCYAAHPQPLRKIRAPEMSAC